MKKEDVIDAEEIEDRQEKIEASKLTPEQSQQWQGWRKGAINTVRAEALRLLSGLKTVLPSEQYAGLERIVINGTPRVIDQYCGPAADKIDAYTDQLELTVARIAAKRPSMSKAAMDKAINDAKVSLALTNGYHRYLPTRRQAERLYQDACNKAVSLPAAEALKVIEQITDQLSAMLPKEAE